jgi:diaminopimelate epimerase
MRFAKGHGTENDFVILVDPGGDLGLTAELVARLCHRRAGLGADGVLRAVRAAAVTGSAGPDAAAGAAPPPQWFMDYRNADGSVAEMCGNGIRVFARYLAEHGLVTGSELTVATRSGTRRVWLRQDGEITVDMGQAAVLGPGHAVIGGEPCQGLRVSIGNPHLVCLVDRPVDEFDLVCPPELDPRQFPDGANVEVVQITGTQTVAMRVHERGSGETRSCGTGAVAAAAAANQASGQPGGAWQVWVPGGRLGVVIEGGTGYLTGPAVIVAEGDLDPAWLAATETVASPGAG